MRLLPAKLLLYFCFSLIFFVFARQTHALAKFNTSYQVYYKVADTGLTHVTFVISQKNNLSIVYATEFGISVNETKIANLKVKDEGVEVTPVVVKNTNQTLISFPFAKKVVGKDKIHNFSIEYDTTDIVEKLGNTWQINIPRFESDENVTDQTAILTLPANFPQPAYIDPKPDIVNGSTYYFSSKILANKPISAIFGNNQYYKGNLKYYLENQFGNAEEMNITLPPNTSYQTVYYESINPKPDRVENDQDGNLLAFYKLKPNQELDIEAKLFIKTDFLPRQSIFPKNNSYTEKNKIWDYDANIFTIPELNNLSSPKSIYDYVANKLKYDYQKINRNGTIRVPASDSLKNYISAICTDYTDLFVSLARKANIPARELEGLALSENPDLKPISTSQDVLHAWPEYYDDTKKLWIQVDPTWGSTTRGMDYFSKLDFNHLVFAIHGVSTDNPTPAGGFKKPGVNTSSIQFEAIEEIVFPKNDIKVSPGKSTSKTISFVIQNLNGVYQTGTLLVQDSVSHREMNEKIVLPPFASQEFILSKKPFSFLSKNKEEVIISLNGTQYSLPAPQENFFQKVILFTGASLFLGVLTLVARSLLLRRRK